MFCLQCTKAAVDWVAEPFGNQTLGEVTTERPTDRWPEFKLHIKAIRMLNKPECFRGATNNMLHLYRCQEDVVGKL